MTKSQQEEFARHVVQQLRAAGFEALFAGGCVRDLLMGNEAADYDVATSATPEQVRELFGKKRTIAVGAAFGVMIVLGPNKAAGQVEVATFRTDATYSDGRRPDSVTYSTPEHDAQRRDFTINGMFYDPLAEEVIDFVGGRADLERKVIRAIGDPAARIAEDKLRMLRAVRFAARFDFQIEDATREAVGASANQVSVVSGERIAVEVQKTLSTAQAAWAVQEWQELGLLASIFPEIAQGWKDRQDVLQQVLGAAQRESWQVIVAAMYVIAQAQESQLTALKSSLKLSNTDAEAIRFAVLKHAFLLESSGKKWSEVQPLVVNSHFATALKVLQLTEDVYDACGAAAELAARMDAVSELDPEPLLLGQDLIDSGLKPGPEFKRLLQDARNLQLDGELDSKSEALQWLKRRVGN
ncbi:MAG: CCA tRNA nucleotidyltransferase [Planctomycetota bacterium]